MKSSNQNSNVKMPFTRRPQLILFYIDGVLCDFYGVLLHQKRKHRVSRTGSRGNHCSGAEGC